MISWQMERPEAREPRYHVIVKIVDKNEGQNLSSRIGTSMIDSVKRTEN